MTAKIHFVRGKYLHRGFLWKQDTFCQRKVSAQKLLVEAKIHFVGGKYLPRDFLKQQRYILSEKSICPEASCDSADAFFRREASAQRLFGAEKMHFVGGKHLHRGFLWKRRYILSEGSICKRSRRTNEDTPARKKASSSYGKSRWKMHKLAFCWGEASAPRLFGAAQMHFVRGKHLHKGFLKQRRCIFLEKSICKRTRRTNEDTPDRKKASSSYGKSRLVL